MLCERLQSHKIIRFSLTRLERAVVRTQQQARTTNWQTVAPLIDDKTAARLNELLLTVEDGRSTPLNRLRTGAAASA